MYRFKVERDVTRLGALLDDSFVLVHMTGRRQLLVLRNEREDQVQVRHARIQPVRTNNTHSTQLIELMIFKARGERFG